MSLYVVVFLIKPRRLKLMFPFNINVCNMDLKEIKKLVAEYERLTTASLVLTKLKFIKRKRKRKSFLHWIQQETGNIFIFY